jgi:hypothetical protein
MDFTLRGEWNTIRFLCETVPFLGARLAGIHRLGRGAAENPRAFAVKGFMMAAASVALYAMNLAMHGDDWDKLEDFDRDTYFHFWIGGKHFRLPKPFEVGFLFGTIPERIAEQFATNKPKKVLLASVARGVMDQLAFNPLPQAIKPLIEQAANKDFFRERPIVSQGLERKLPAEQHNQYTSRTARGLAEFFDALLSPVLGKTGGNAGDALRSPVRLEHMVNGFFGGLGAAVLGMSDMVLDGLGGGAPKPERRLQDMPVVRSFYRGSKGDAGHERYTTALYNAMNEANKLYDMVKQNGQAGKAKLDPDELALLAQRNGMNAAAKRISLLNKMAESVRQHKDMSPESKRKRLDQLQEQKNSLARKIVRLLEAKGWAA